MIRSLPLPQRRRYGLMRGGMGIKSAFASIGKKMKPLLKKLARDYLSVGKAEQVKKIGSEIIKDGSKILTTLAKKKLKIGGALTDGPTDSQQELLNVPSEARGVIPSLPFNPSRRKKQTRKKTKKPSKKRKKKPLKKRKKSFRCWDKNKGKKKSHKKEKKTLFGIRLDI